MTVAFIGLGNMGGRIARRLVDGGENVVGHDADPTKARTHPNRGAQMRVVRGREGRPTEHRTQTFTGDVFADSVLLDEGLMVNSVFFTPSARTYWHRHEVAQVLYVTHGRGLLWSSDEGGGAVLEPGDVAHIPAGERHWHGGAPESFLLHLAISVGKTEWLEEVSDDDYQEAIDALTP